MGEVEMVLSLSNTYHRTNSGRSQEETAREIEFIVQEGNRTGTEMGIALANAWHCVYEGDTPLDVVISWIDRLQAWRPPYVLLADTTGFARPQHVAALVRTACHAFPDLTFGVHLHVLEERDDGVIKAAAALENGASFIDTSLLDIGGSPFAPGVGTNLGSRAVAEAGMFDLDLAGLSFAESLLASAIIRAGGRATNLRPYPK